MRPEASGWLQRVDRFLAHSFRSSDQPEGPQGVDSVRTIMSPDPALQQIASGVAPEAGLDRVQPKVVHLPVCSQRMRTDGWLPWDASLHRTWVTMGDLVMIGLISGA